MGCAHGVDVRLLHEADVLQHTLFGHHTCLERVVLQTVDATETHLLAVDEKHTMTDSELSETYFLSDALCRL